MASNVTADGSGTPLILPPGFVRDNYSELRISLSDAYTEEAALVPYEGGPLIGSWAVSVLLGVLTAQVGPCEHLWCRPERLTIVLQVYSYFREYERDPPWMKLLVIIVW